MSAYRFDEDVLFVEVVDDVLVLAALWAAGLVDDDDLAAIVAKPVKEQQLQSV
jgi:hypothetical protein